MSEDKKPKTEYEAKPDQEAEEQQTGQGDGSRQRRRGGGPSSILAPGEKPKNFRKAIADTLSYMGAYKYAIVVVHIESDFYAQVKAGSHIAVRTRVKHVGNKSFHLDQEVIDADSEEVKCHCLSVMVLYDLEEQKSILIPDKWAKAIRDFEGLNED